MRDISVCANTCVCSLHSDSLLTILLPSCIPFVTVVEGTVNKVKSLLLAAQDWEQRMKAALKEKSVVIVYMFRTI